MDWESFWIVGGNREAAIFRKGSKRLWKDFETILEGVWKDFGRILDDGFWKVLGSWVLNDLKGLG